MDIQSGQFPQSSTSGTDSPEKGILQPVITQRYRFLNMLLRILGIPDWIIDFITLSKPDP